MHIKAGGPGRYGIDHVFLFPGVTARSPPPGGAKCRKEVYLLGHILETLIKRKNQDNTGLYEMKYGTGQGRISC